MKILKYLFLATIICSICFAKSVVIEITPDNMERHGYNISINEKNDLLIFDVTCPPLWRRESHSIAVLIINEEEITVSKSNLEKTHHNKENKVSFYFEVSKNYLEHSIFEYTLYLQKHPALDRRWFNLKKMYDGLKAIEEEKN